MIIKNIFGILAVLVVILILATVFNNIGDDIKINEVKNNLEIVRQATDVMCMSFNTGKSMRVDTMSTKANYLLTLVDNRSICIKSEDYFSCERFDCEIHSTSNILINHSIVNEVNEKAYYKCVFEKVSKSVVKITCERFFDI